MNYLKILKDWFKQKINIHENFIRQFPKKGDVWIAELGVNIGSEQNHSRPVLIIKSPTSKKDHTCVIIPASRTIRKSSFQIGKYHFLLHQIKVIDTKRLKRKIERLPKNQVDKLRDSLYKFFS